MNAELIIKIKEKLHVLKKAIDSKKATLKELSDYKKLSKKLQSQEIVTEKFDISKQNDLEDNQQNGDDQEKQNHQRDKNFQDQIGINDIVQKYKEEDKKIEEQKRSTIIFDYLEESKEQQGFITLNMEQELCKIISSQDNISISDFVSFIFHKNLKGDKHKIDEILRDQYTPMRPGVDKAPTRVSLYHIKIILASYGLSLKHYQIRKLIYHVLQEIYTYKRPKNSIKLLSMFMISKNKISKTELTKLLKEEKISYLIIEENAKNYIVRVRSKIIKSKVDRFMQEYDLCDVN